MGEPLIILLLLCTGLCYQILYAFNCGSDTILHSPLLKYTSDEMYEGLNSKGFKKQALPPKYIDPVDTQLLLSERTTEGHAFSYFLRLTGQDHYILLFKFIEVVYDKPKQRVFEIRLGDEKVLEVDIVGEVGVGEVLHRWIQFELRDDVIYVNNTMPVLNAYIYPKQTMKFTLARIMGQPKIEAFILLKGADSQKFISQYLQYQNSKNKKSQENTSMKYQRQPQHPYKRMTGTEQFDLPQQSLTYYMGKIFSLNTAFSLLAVAFVLLHEKIYERLNIPKQQIKDQ